MKKSTIVIIVSSVVLLGIASAFLPVKDLGDFWEVFSNAVGALSSIITLIIALLLYRKFGIDQNFVDKQAEVVFEVADLLRYKHFRVDTGGGSIMLNFSRLDVSLDDYREYFALKVLMSDSYLYSLRDIIQISKNKFLPKEIASSIASIDIVFSSKPKDGIDYGKVYGEQHQHDYLTKEPINISESNWFLSYSLDPKRGLVETDFQKLATDWSLLAQTVKKWIEGNTSGQKLNL